MPKGTQEMRMSHAAFYSALAIAAILTTVCIVYWGGLYVSSYDDESDAETRSHTHANTTRSGQRSAIVRKWNGSQRETLKAWFCDMTNASGISLLAKANSLAAQTRLAQAANLDAQQGLLTLAALMGDGDVGILSIDALELADIRDAVVLVFEDEEEEMVVYIQPLSEESTVIGGSHGATLPAVAVSKVRAAALAQSTFEGIACIEGPVNESNTREIWIPPGQVVVGLRYANGTFSNFVPLERWSSEEQGIGNPGRSASN